MGLRVAARRWVQGEVQEPVLCLSHPLFAGPAWLAMLGLRPGSVCEKGGGEQEALAGGVELEALAAGGFLGLRMWRSPSVWAGASGGVEALEATGPTRGKVIEGGGGVGEA